MTILGFKGRNHPQQVAKRGVDIDTDDRRTPERLFTLLHNEFGFTLDAAASWENTKCARYFSIENSGLDGSWAGHSVWCNPPYSAIRPWVEKAWAESGRCPVIVMLLPANRTEQGWWQDLVETQRRSRQLEVRFLPGRLKFDRPNWTVPKKGNRPPFGCCLLIWRPLVGALDR